MTTMVSTFERSSSVRASWALWAPGGADVVPATQEHTPATSASAVAKPRAAAKLRSNGWRDTPGVMLIMHASLNRGAATCLERPGSADRQSVGVAELRIDPLVLGAKREPPGFGLHSHAVSESVVGLILAEENGFG